MSFNSNLELNPTDFNQTIEILMKNGNRVSTQFYGSRKILYADGILCGYSKVEKHLPLSESLTNKQFYMFLASFKKSLYSQIDKNNELLGLNIEYDGISKFKNHKGWKKVKPRSVFYIVDINSAYWQFAFRLGYISKKLYLTYMYKPEYKEVKRYAISFLSRENEMQYFDNREINHVVCDISVFQQIYDNIRNEIYRTIELIASQVPNYIEQNIDSISVSEKDLELTKSLFESFNLEFKVQEAIKIDNSEYSTKGKIRNF